MRKEYVCERRWNDSTFLSRRGSGETGKGSVNGSERLAMGCEEIVE